MDVVPENGTGLTSITGPEAHDLLDAAVAQLGGELLGWSTSQVDHRPSGTTVASYLVDIQWPGGRRSETLAARLGSGNGPSAPPGCRHVLPTATARVRVDSTNPVLPVRPSAPMRTL